MERRRSLPRVDGVDQLNTGFSPHSALLRAYCQETRWCEGFGDDRIVLPFRLHGLADDALRGDAGRSRAGEPAEARARGRPWRLRARAWAGSPARLQPV